MRRPLTIKFLRAMIDFILKKAWKRTLSGKNFRETLSWAESSVSQNRNSHRLGAARRYVGRDGISRYREHERHNNAERTLWPCILFSERKRVCGKPVRGFLRHGNRAKA